VAIWTIALVRSVLGQPPLRLGVQPLVRVDTHLPGCGFGRQGVPGEVSSLADLAEPLHILFE